LHFGLKPWPEHFTLPLARKSREVGGEMNPVFRSALNASRLPSGRWSLLIALLSVLHAGCSIATLGTALPIDPGTSQIVVAPSVVRVALSGKPYTGPQVELGGRYGVSKNVDIGARIWLPLPGYSLDSRIALLRSEDREHGFDIGLQPGVSYLYVPGGEADSSPLHIASATLPLLLGWNLGGGKQLVVAPKLIDVLSASGSVDGKAANLLTMATTVGFIWPLTSNFSVAPEVGIGKLLLGSVQGFGSDLWMSGVSGQVSLGFLFGGHAQPPPRCVPDTP
jgi:hypothetical protein